MTSAPGLTYQEVKALNPCADSFRRVTKLLGGARKWNGKKISAREAREAGATYDDILWAAGRLERGDKDVERRLRLFAADCAAHVLHLFQREHPTDMRPRNAIIAARQYARGEITKDVFDAAWDAAMDAAMDATLAAERDAARDAALAAARDAARAAALAAALVAARAAARAAAWDAALAAAWDAEREWQFDRLIARLSDDEPEDYPLPEPPQ